MEPTAPEPDLRLSALWRGLCDLLAPTRCLGCDAVIADMGDAAPVLVHGVPLDGFCGACALVVDEDDLHGPAPAAFLYGGPLADGVLRLKHGDRADVGDGLGDLLGEVALPWARALQVEAVVAVPSHARRLRARGYEVSALLAGPLADRLGVCLRFDLLERRRPTPPQRGRSAADRRGNVRGAFAGGRRRPAKPPQAVLLVDDVRASGATLGEAARVLREDVGVAVVHPLALARQPLRGAP